MTILRREGTRFALIAGTMTCVTLCFAANARAAFHQWVFNELFSNADGTVQFIEFSNGPATGEVFMTSATIDSNASPTYHFDHNLPLTANTANKKLLVATSGFVAALPSVPPDYILPDNFFSITGDTLVFSEFYDTFTFGGVPTDGVMSLNRNLSTGTNSPTNFAGMTGALNLSTPVPGDANGDGYVDIFDINLVSSQWNTAGPEADVNDDNIVDIFDINFISSHWNPAPASAPVPEPASCVLAVLAAGALGMIRLARRRA